MLEQTKGIKKTSLVQKEKVSLPSGRKIKSPYGKSTCSTPNITKCNSLVNKSNIVIVEDDDLIPPTPSPARQHSFINCQGQRSALSKNIHLQNSPDFLRDEADNSEGFSGTLKSSSEISGTKAKGHDFSKISLHDEWTVTKVHDHLSSGNAEPNLNKTVQFTTNSIALSKNACNSTTEGLHNNSEQSDLNAPPCNSVDTPSTLITSRKTYKLSRKGKPPKVVSSPVKKHHIYGSGIKSPHNQKKLHKKTEMPDQKASTPVIAPSKCVVLKSRMKRAATKGSSPLQKRLQTELPSSVKVMYCIYI